MMYSLSGQPLLKTRCCLEIEQTEKILAMY